MNEVKYWIQGEDQGILYPRQPSTVFTPFSLYEEDQQFDIVAPKIARWIARKLGYPILDIQITDQLIYTMIEQSLLQFAAIINQQKAAESLFELLGVSHDDLVKLAEPIITHKRFVARLAQQYADRAGVGLHTKLYRGYIDTVSGKTHYSLDTDWTTEGGKPDNLNGKRVDIHYVYYVHQHDRGRQQWSLFMIPGLINSQASIAYMLWYPQGIMAPLEMMLYKQKRELVESVFMATKSYRLYNNQIIITPKPRQQGHLLRIFFEYTIDDLGLGLSNESQSQSEQETPKVSGFQNVPYNYYRWSYLNQFSRNWVRKYALANSKQTLGMIRNVYDSLPTAQGDMSLDGGQLISNAVTQKQQLRNELRQKLAQLKPAQKMMQRRQIAQNLNQTQKYHPLEPIIG